MRNATVRCVDILLFNWWQHFSHGWLGFDFIEGIPVILVISIILVGNVTVNIIKRKLQPLQQLQLHQTPGADFRKAFLERPRGKSAD